MPVAWFGPLYAVTFLGAVAGAAAVPRLRASRLSPGATYAFGSNVCAAAGLLAGAASFTPLMAKPSLPSCVALQACPDPNPKP